MAWRSCGPRSRRPPSASRRPSRAAVTWPAASASGAAMTEVAATSQEQGWATAKTLAEALPYIQIYDREIVVIKYGGHAMGEEEVAKVFAADAVLLKLLGLHPVVVHGGGPQISRMLEKARDKSTLVDGHCGYE